MPRPSFQILFMHVAEEGQSVVIRNVKDAECAITSLRSTVGNILYYNVNVCLARGACARISRVEDLHGKYHSGRLPVDSGWYLQFRLDHSVCLIVHRCTRSSADVALDLAIKPGVQRVSRAKQDARSWESIVETIDKIYFLHDAPLLAGVHHFIVYTIHPTHNEYDVYSSSP